ncbi:type II toxin-antitoxin system RnlB family antitoxin [Paenibacillus pabuli]|uniref:type II toxin-antitoxin system RnlB family antitoxin n=1 Tax=Paenibacillus pabuli TaxID=1472 RepID=UPI0034582DC0
MHTTTIIPTQDFIIVDLSDSHYDKLVIGRHSESRIGGIKHHMPEGFTGRIIIDWMTSVGTKNNERFLELQIVGGEIDPDSLSYVKLKLKDDLRILCNRTLVHHSSDSLEASVLTIIEKKMLRKGLSM